MPATAHMKILLHEAEVEQAYRRRQSHIDDPKHHGKPHDYTKDPKIKKRTRFYDETKDPQDSFSNIDVGTRFRHLPFIYNKHGKRIGFRNEPLNFAHVVDLDANYYEGVVYTRFLREILASTVFRMIIMVLVLINAFVIGLNTIDVNDRYRKELEILDQILFTAFAFEIFMKWSYDFRAFWINAWNVLDFVLFMWILFASSLPLFLAARTILITIRVARALRSLRFLSCLSSLTVVSHTILKSFVDMFNILFVLIIFMVVLAIAGVVLFEDEKLKTSRFLNALDAWFVLFICVTQDGWIEVLNQFKDTDYEVQIAIYLIIGVTIGAFVFANLIIAVVVANLESSIKLIKSRKIDTSNPLVYDAEFSPNEVEIMPSYKPFRHHFRDLLEQRPFTAPVVKTNKRRRLRCYVHLLVALEQNLLEFSAVEDDLLRLLGVMLSIYDQMECDEYDIAAYELAKQEALDEKEAKYVKPFQEKIPMIERPVQFMDPHVVPHKESDESEAGYESSSSSALSDLLDAEGV